MASNLTQKFEENNLEVPRRQLKIFDIRGYNFPKTPSCHSLNSHFYVTLECGENKKTSKVSTRGRNPNWSREEFIFDYAGGSLRIKAYAHHLLSQDELVGELETRGATFVRQTNTENDVVRIRTGPVNGHLIPPTAAIVDGEHPSISFKYHLVDVEEENVHSVSISHDKSAGSLAKAAIFISAVTSTGSTLLRSRINQ
ncbi:hypothetical protein SISSUDRAFT_1059875 [Sistotremastrum suecicum HHB10207 ss-3]|uniref:C2 domain-containing protein n=1 Tax=Sistotremastrum suecicum HHB10207 ss-3 TaxID=1314776 RepID=A0A166FTK5_9AGAM|nr:hypothetical protein SISSUDRAFT_1059875 [Sistotremastrum suecicum HHB10207 ss-3]